MSVEAAKTAEETPASKAVPVEQPELTPPKATENPAVAESTVAAAVTSDDAAPAPATENPTAENSTVVAAIPASEGTLGYKEHGFLKSFRYSKHFFWFAEEPLTADALAHFVKSEKGEAAHHSAAWAQETGNGVLLYAKRAEDKANPAGVIVLADASTVVKEGTTEFSFTVAKVHHRFQANTSIERDSWIVALEKKIEEAKALKEEITGRESYKKTIEGFAVASPTAATTRASSKGPKKSLDAATATAAASQPAAPAAPAETASTTSDEDKNAKKEEKKEAEKAVKKERSQSRKRASIFGMLGKKDEDKELKKEEKAEKKAEKEHLKEEKKIEAEQKKEEAKATHDPNHAVEAAEAAAVAAAPAAAVAAVEKKEDKKEEDVSTPTDKKNKRASVFGSFFSKKNVTSPATEKTEKEATAPLVPAKDTDVPPVSETAPKLDEPIENKPIDPAAVTAPADTVETPVAAAPGVEPTTETSAAPATETVASPKTEKKGFLSGFMKKSEAKKEEKKEEAQEEKAAEQAARDPVAAAAAPTDSAADAATETPVAESSEAKDERPAREKRRTSFFGALGTIKKKTETSEGESSPVEVKREKSPLPSKLGGMFRKPSKAVKSTEADKPAETATEAEATKPDTPATQTTGSATVEAADSKFVGGAPTEGLVHDAVTTAPTTNPEVSTSA